MRSGPGQRETDGIMTEPSGARVGRAPRGATRVKEDCLEDTGSPAWSCSRRTDARRAAVLEKTQEFFQTCDIEDKGFITRRDMQRLYGELPLSADELENVFDTLDADGNGYLTLEEFSSGFSEFLFGRRITMSEATENHPPPGALYQRQWEERLAENEDDEEKHFCMLLESLGACNVFEDPGEVRRLWTQLRRDEPHLLSNFEEFLARVTLQIKEANQEKHQMESALKRKAATHDDELQRLYEEMEQQIKSEKDRILLQVKDSERFLTRSHDLEQQLSGKEQELEQLIQKQRRLERQCRELHSEQQETRVENVRLKQTNEELMRELEHTCQQLTLAQEQLELLQQEGNRLQEEREMEMYRVTEGLQRERTSLLKQLDLLREMNKHLRDERDMCYLKPKNSIKMSFWNQISGAMPLKYMEGGQDPKSEDEVDVSKSSKRKTLARVNGHGPLVSQDNEERPPSSHDAYLHRVISIEEDPLPQALRSESRPTPQWSIEEEEEEVEEEASQEMSNIYLDSTLAPPANEAWTTAVKGDPRPSASDTPSSPRGQPVGKETITNEEAAVSTPDRLFKIVLVGNSSVGKTSVLRRFCDDCFHPGTLATVGIDYSVKALMLEKCKVALQMWDTAGQERYRSITKQFFRKADGVIVMYDIASQQSFMAVRHWLESVNEGAGGNIPIMLLGNKTDHESKREVQTRVAEKLAKDFHLIFYECSASTGHNVTEAMVHLARTLKEQEDQEKEKTIHLAENPSKKRSCC
ncbi:ras and EF-hand domain-containing protein homolog [Scleropages formosus]|uniref:Calcium release activated channel regulator 2A n=1 Tax=Scleropages formosus TaxID=113540 RepID=A0A8C9RHM2_SCLFO|nr:ras and EF-hand domain-containing protein homolog [Scleropages formosus]XP_029105426.1 ras and EF-hand domain-containing protein homolog [Scleropages formosus]